MKDLNQTITRPFHAQVSFLLKSTIAIMGSHGQGEEMCLSFLLSLPTLDQTRVFLRLVVAPFELGCILFAILSLNITTALKETSCR